MRKFSYLILTVSLSFFVLFLNKGEFKIAFDTPTNQPSHKLKNDHSFNAFAISIDNSFEIQSISFEEDRKEPNVNHFYATATINESLLNNDLHYLKACNFFNYNLTRRDIIYPFHSFL